MTSFNDQTLVCDDCKNNFVFTAGEQEFFSKKGFTNTPKRCPDCRSKKKAQHGRGGGGGGYSSGYSSGGGGGGGGGYGGGGRGRSEGGRGGDKPKFPATCTQCGADFMAPFQPKEGLPVLCRECFQEKKSRGGGGRY